MGKHRDRQTDKGEEYIRSYPGLQKWINQCVNCQTRGYDPDRMPDSVGFVSNYAKRNNWDSGKYTARYIRKFFKPLPLDDCGLCQMCSREKL